MYVEIRDSLISNLIMKCLQGLKFSLNDNKNHSTSLLNVDVAVDITIVRVLFSLTSRGDHKYGKIEINYEIKIRENHRMYFIWKYKSETVLFMLCLLNVELFEMMMRTRENLRSSGIDGRKGVVK